MAEATVIGVRKVFDEALPSLISLSDPRLDDVFDTLEEKLLEYGWVDAEKRPLVQWRKMQEFYIDPKAKTTTVGVCLYRI